MPERNQYQIKTLTIDGKQVCASEDQTILEVARENGIDIPTLCHFSGLREIGACRLCVVEVKGSNKLLASCATQAQEGMEITVHSQELREYRKLIVELLLTERNHVCAVCVSSGHCELQTLAQKLGVDHVTLPYLNRCILCSRCLRVCDEIEGAHTWDLTGRGIAARMITDMGEPWGNSATCTQCGKCVMVCPVGALVAKGKSVAEMTKPEFLPYLLQMRGEDRR
jgi:bidirectional [NiFe] hydrogenase diaphorase subunit